MTQSLPMHENVPPLIRGRLSDARAVMILMHGRGASPEDILSLTDGLPTDGFALIAPRATGNTWYPYSFLEPLARNEPYLSSALNTLDIQVRSALVAGIPFEKIVLLGFSQGACLALEYAARNAKRYGGIIGLSGGLIGAEDTARDYAGTFAETPIFLGCSTTDFHIPKSRVEESAAIFARMGATVTTRLYPDMGHTVNDDELSFVSELMTSISAPL